MPTKYGFSTPEERKRWVALQKVNEQLFRDKLAGRIPHLSPIIKDFITDYENSQRTGISWLLWRITGIRSGWEMVKTPSGEHRYQQYKWRSGGCVILCGYDAQNHLVLACTPYDGKFEKKLGELTNLPVIQIAGVIVLW